MVEAVSCRLQGLAIDTFPGCCLSRQENNLHCEGSTRNRVPSVHLVRASLIIHSPVHCLDPSCSCTPSTADKERCGASGPRAPSRRPRGLAYGQRHGLLHWFILLAWHPSRAVVDVQVVPEVRQLPHRQPYASDPPIAMAIARVRLGGTASIALGEHSSSSSSMTDEETSSTSHRTTSSRR